MEDSLTEPPFCWGCFLRQTIIHQIDIETDPAEKKAKIMLAYEHGHLSRFDAEDWIVSNGLGDA